MMKDERQSPTVKYDDEGGVLMEIFWIFDEY